MSELSKLISKLESEKQKKTIKRDELDKKISSINSQLKELYTLKSQQEKLSQSTQ